MCPQDIPVTWLADADIGRTARISVLAELLAQYLRKFEVVAEHPVIGARDVRTLMALASGWSFARLLQPGVAIAGPVTHHGYVRARVHAVVLQALADAYTLGGVHCASPPLTCINTKSAESFRASPAHDLAVLITCRSCAQARRRPPG